MTDKLKNLASNNLFRLVASFIILLIILDISFPFPNLKPYSKTVYSNNGALLNSYLANDDKWRMRTRLDEVTPESIKANDF